MKHDHPQHEVWDPFRELGSDGLRASQRANVERGQAWALYLNGGGGDPRYFDYEAYIRNVERCADRER